MTHLKDNTLKPAFSFAQIAKIDDQRKLFSVEFSDTMLLIKHADGSSERPNVLRGKGNYGLGDNSHPSRLKIQVATTDVEGDEVYGFSDGIGEFLSMAELQEIIANNQERGLPCAEDSFQGLPCLYLDPRRHHLSPPLEFSVGSSELANGWLIKS